MGPFEHEQGEEDRGHADDPGLPEGLRVSALQRSAQLTAQLAREIAGRQGGDEAFLAGMLKDVGTLALLPLARERLAAVYQHDFAGGQQRLEVERKVFGATLSEVGAYLLSLWGLQPAVVDAVRNRYGPVHALDVNGAVSLASALVDEDQGAKDRVDASGLERSGLAGKLPGWRTRLDEIK